jgi:hypothetical protein
VFRDDTERHQMDGYAKARHTQSRLTAATSLSHNLADASP